MTKTELASTSGLARTTVSSRIDELIDLGLVGVKEAPSTGGRPSSEYSFDVTARVILSFSIAKEQTSAAVTDLNGTVLGRTHQSLSMAAGPAVVLAGAIDMAQELLDDLAAPIEAVAGIGVALIGYAEISTGRQNSLPVVLQKWTSAEVQSRLHQYLPVPILIDNDVNALALGEHTLNRGVDDLIVINIAGGVGAGVIAGGELQRGAHNMAGGVGHARVPRGFDIVCRCGNIGCLEAHISIKALTSKLRMRGIAAEGASDISALVASGENEAIQAVRQAGRDLGATLAVYVSVMNPTLVAISDPLAEAGELLLTELRDTIREQASPMVTGNLEVVRVQSAETTALIGASQMVISQVLSPAGIESMLNSHALTAAASSNVAQFT